MNQIEKLCISELYFQVVDSYRLVWYNNFFYIWKVYQSNTVINDQMQELLVLSMFIYLTLLPLHAMMFLKYRGT